MIDELWRRFIEALAPLKQAGKLKAVHFQFAPWVLRNRAGQAHVRECGERMAGHLLAVEFRHQSWFERAEVVKSTLDFERELGVVHVVVDGPQGFRNSVPTVWEQTSDELAILRLPGRNDATWGQKWLSAASDRFNYDYSEEELAGFDAGDYRDGAEGEGGAGGVQQQYGGPGAKECAEFDGFVGGDWWGLTFGGFASGRCPLHLTPFFLGLSKGLV
ncbi:MAG: hypothetical protein JWP29_2026 [Rhodoferax sp.]|nr:hypothetical protein [Rhodoferax sp.]